ncbi:MAG: response regulator [Pseudomonadota bacterium]
MISVRNAVALMLGTIAALLLGLGYVTTWQLRTAALQAEAETRRHESFRIAESMRQSSDQLTMMVRLYVSTGEVRYRDYFEEILAIRSGTAPRPLDYDGSFWDRVLAHGKAGVQYGPPQSLVQMMRTAQFPEAEFTALNASREASDALAQIEIEVMKQVAQRIARGVDARYIDEVYPDYQRLVGPDYLAHKDRIMAAIKNFQMLIDQRTLAEVEALRARSQRLLTSQISFLVLMLAMSLLAFLISERALTRPLHQLIELTRRIAGGDYAQRVGSHGLTELDELGSTFNDMASAIQSDIARRERAEAEAQAAQRAAEAANQAKSDFLANMSHEIRTPLNAVIGMAEMMEDTKLDNEQRESLRTISNSGVHLLGVINDILDFSKIEAGMLELDSQVFDLRRCLEDAMELVAPKASVKQLDLALDFVAGTPEGLRGDPQRLRQVLVNLLANAVKFTEQGEVVVSVSARQLLAPDQADAEAGTRHEFLFEVRDTGIGIPADRMDRLFKTFSQVDNSTTRHYGGTGLGLVISKRLTEMMGGRVSVDSVVGQGSVFRFSIVAETSAEWASYPQGSRVDFEAKRVLIVDDNDTNRRLLRAAAELWGMQVRDTAYPKQALEWIGEGEHFDVAVLDYLMPDMDGKALGSAIRRYRDARQLPMIMASSAQMTRRLAPDFAAVVAKPLRRSTLFDAFQDALLGERIGRLPQEAARPGSDVEELAADGQTLAAVLPASPVRVLLVEDNETNQKVTTRMLRSLGYQSDLAVNGAEAVAAVQARPYDVVLMDVHMPVMDGLEATRRIRALPLSPRPRVFAMTASSLDSERLECVEAGMERHISKPVQRKVLAAALADVLYAEASTLPEASSAAGEDIEAHLDGQVSELSREGVLELIDSLISEREKTCTALLASCAARDGIVLKRLTHSLRANCAMVGAELLAERFAAMERRAKAGDLDGTELEVRQLEQDYSRLVERLATLRPRYI